MPGATEQGGCIERVAIRQDSTVYTCKEGVLWFKKVVGGISCVSGFDACGWNGCCRPGKVGLLVRNEVRAEDLRKNWTI